MKYYLFDVGVGVPDYARIYTDSDNYRPADWFDDETSSWIADETGNLDVDIASDGTWVAVPEAQVLREIAALVAL
ncbi:hypothetical protein [Aeromicrobium sp.]|uniref:hypothetical protein n=1 Tax=Aeromicrobium sp. TaxID=1871063 RepID=UPI002FC94796